MVNKIGSANRYLFIFAYTQNQGTLANKIYGNYKRHAYSCGGQYRVW